MKLMVAGGGTGGHVYPGIALVDEFRKLVPELQVKWIGTSDRMEARAVPAANIPIEFLDVSFLKGRRGVALLKSLFSLPMSGVNALRIVRRFRPDALVGLGGFVSGPVVVAAFLCGVPVFLLEQNAIPGVANRINARFARTIFGTFAECANHFPASKTEILGNPIREDILSVSPQPRADGTPLRVLVFGGSQGATTLNETIPATLSEAASRADIRLKVIHGSGRGRAEGIAERYDSRYTDVTVMEYIDGMAAVYAATDFVVCRAGATTISELTAMGLPACYVPFPHAADNHQMHNARSVELAGGGVVVEDSEAGDEGAIAMLASVFGRPDAVAEMATAAKSVGQPGAGLAIAQHILRSVGSKPALEVSTDLGTRR